MSLFSAEIRVNSGKNDWHATCEATKTYDPHQKEVVVNGNESVDEKTNRALTRTLQEPQINTDCLRITGFLVEVVEDYPLELRLLAEIQ
jgi:hypothetical protein